MECTPSQLHRSRDTECWHAAEQLYAPVIHALAVKKPKLPQLDAFVAQELPHILATRRAVAHGCAVHVTHAELCKIMEWKLLRGKWRPRLQGFVDALAPALVESTTNAAIAAADDGRVAQAVTLLSALKGVGPATATAVLMCASPHVAFMSDEVLQLVVGTRNYTLAEAVALTRACQNIAQELNEVAARRTDARSVMHSEWDARRVHNAMWACCTAHGMGAAFVAPPHSAAALPHDAVSVTSSSVLPAAAAAAAGAGVRSQSVGTAAPAPGAKRTRRQQTPLDDTAQAGSSHDAVPTPAPTTAPAARRPRRGGERA